MTERTYWIIMGAWTVVVLAMIGWMWWTIRKAEKAHDVEEAFQNELLAEAEEYSRSHAKSGIRLNTAEEWANYEREALGVPPILNNSRDYESKPFALDENEQPHKPAA